MRPVRKKSDSSPEWFAEKQPAITALAGFTTDEADRPSDKGAWFDVPIARGISLTPEEWFVEKFRLATLMMKECVEIDPETRSGVPLLRGTRFPVSRILADLADGLDVKEIADDYDLDLVLIMKLLDGMAAYLGRPFP